MKEIGRFRSGRLPTLFLFVLNRSLFFKRSLICDFGYRNLPTHRSRFDDPLDWFELFDRIMPSVTLVGAFGTQATAVADRGVCQQKIAGIIKVKPLKFLLAADFNSELPLLTVTAIPLDTGQKDGGMSTRCNRTQHGAEARCSFVATVELRADLKADGCVGAVI